MSVPPPTSKPIERRRQPRVSFDCPVTIALPDGEFDARLRDLSTSGVCFFLDRRIPEMTVLQMQLPLGEEKTIQGSGVVVRCQPVSPHVDHYEVALFFSDLSEDSRRDLAEFVGARG